MKPNHSYAGLRVKSVKINLKGSVPDTFRAVRECLGKKIPDMKNVNPYLVEHSKHTKDFLTSTVLNYAKELGAKEVVLRTNIGTKTRLISPIEHLGKRLRSKRKEDHLSMYDIQGMSQATVYTAKSGKRDCYLGTYMNYAKELHINELVLSL